MGRGEEKPGFMGSKWMTIILIAVLLIVGAILIWVLATGGFERFKKKRKPGALKPTIGQQLHNPNHQPRLELVDSRLRVVAELSWQRSMSPPQV